MVGYKHPCRYCNQFIPAGSSVCPLCSKINPLGPLRCPQCRHPVQNNWKSCNHCGLALNIECPYCQQSTYFSEYCQHCQAQLIIKCKNAECGKEQPPIGVVCIECGEPFEKQEQP